MRTVDLFCGCGGLSLGFQNAGFDIVASYDSWDAAVRCYGDNFDHPVHKEDLADPTDMAAKIQELAPEIIIGGPPCQDFSHAGKRSEAARADLTKAFATIITTILPQWFVMENVDRAQKSRAYAEAKRIFKSARYGLTECVLDASLCGVPQKRKRFFCIGRLQDSDGFLNGILSAKQSKTPLTVRDFLGNDLGIEHYYRHPRNYNRRGVFSIDEPAPTIRGVNRPIPAGYAGHPGDPVPVTGLRPLTTKERSLIQTFPPSFVLTGSKTDVEQMIGNAVPVNLANFIAEAIIMYESGVNNA
jgi:DNA (cytosine-5)-methyltransferase 1